MKFRTVIAVDCEAPNRDEAVHMSGEYLRGEMEEGIKISSCRTIGLVRQRIFKAAFSISIIAIFLSGISFGTTGSDEEIVSSIKEASFCRGYTVSPRLRTHRAADFRKLWTERREIMIRSLRKGGSSQ